jgi:DNA-directed RNA polymerase subunit alpha
VKEDVQDICLNLKDLLLIVHSDEPVTLRLDKRSEGPVTANDLSKTADVEILNPDLHLAYLTNSKSALTFELTVERGKGYVGAEGNKGSSTIGVIPLDAIFTPVRRVSFEIEPVRVEQSKDFDRLVIDIETDGSISPREALASAGKTLGSLVDLIGSFDEEAPSLELGDVGTAQAAASELDIRIEELGLTERSRNCLKRAGINTIAQLVNATERDLTSITNFGATSLKDVTDRLDERGLSLRAED